MNDAHNHSGFEDEFEHEPVPAEHRHSTWSVAAVWFGFPMIITNAVFGGIIAYNLGFWPAIAAIAVGNAILLAYVGTLSFIAGNTGQSFALQSERTFGKVGYRLVSGFLATIVVGWYAFQAGLTGTTIHESYGWNVTATITFVAVLYTAVTYVGIRALSIVGMIAAPLYIALGIVALFMIAPSHPLSDVLQYHGQGAASIMTFGGAVTLVVATFADSGTMTADFTRWAKDGKSAVYASMTAFPFANMIAQIFGIIVVCTGAAGNAQSAGGDFMPTLTQRGGILSIIALIFVFVNLGSVCTHCLYNGAIGWSRIVGAKMRTVTIVLGLIGGVVAAAGVWSYFLSWLNLLGILVPPIGAVIVVDQLVFGKGTSSGADYRGAAFLSWAIGAVAAVVVHLHFLAFSEAVAGMIVAGASYFALAGTSAGWRRYNIPHL